MAFTGVATVTQISDSVCRITGVSLGAGATGTIALFAHAAGPDVILPRSFIPRQYTFDNVAVSLVASLDVTVKQDGTGGIVVAVPVNVVKAGATPSTFLASLTNPTAGASNNLEIYVKQHT